MSDKAMNWIKQSRLRRYSFAIAGALLGSTIFYNSLLIESKTGKKIETQIAEEIQEIPEALSIIKEDFKSRSVQAAKEKTPITCSISKEQVQYTLPNIIPHKSIIANYLFKTYTLLTYKVREENEYIGPEGASYHYQISEDFIRAKRQIDLEKAREKFKLEDMAK